MHSAQARFLLFLRWDLQRLSNHVEMVIKYRAQGRRSLTRMRALIPDVLDFVSGHCCIAAVFKKIADR